jgi:hypothetical protein
MNQNTRRRRQTTTQPSSSTAYFPPRPCAMSGTCIARLGCNHRVSAYLRTSSVDRSIVSIFEESRTAVAHPLDKWRDRLVGELHPTNAHAIASPSPVGEYGRNFAPGLYPQVPNVFQFPHNTTWYALFASPRCIYIMAIHGLTATSLIDLWSLKSISERVIFARINYFHHHDHAQGFKAATCEQGWRGFFGASGDFFFFFAWIGINHGSNCGMTKSSCAELWAQKMRKYEHLVDERRAFVAAKRGFRDKTSHDPFEASFTCHAEHRRGKLFGDGGKFCCGDDEYFKAYVGPSGEKCLVYSVGSNGEASFEADIVSRLGCEVHTFDPTGNTTRYADTLQSVGAKFHSIGVSGVPGNMLNSVTNTTSELRPMKQIMESLGHQKRHIHILKIDCEGCEYSTFTDLWPQIKSGDVTIGQILIEVHGTYFKRLADFFEVADEAGYMLFHKERNHWGCMGYLCLEYSLIHKSEAKSLFEWDCGW